MSFAPFRSVKKEEAMKHDIFRNEKEKGENESEK
jgi:hypothetical protein